MVHSAFVCLQKPAFALGNGIFHVILKFRVTGEGVPAFPLDPQEIPPEIDIAYGILAEGISFLRQRQHLVKGFLQTGKWHLFLHRRRQLPAAQRHHHAQSAALLHRFM